VTVSRGKNFLRRGDGIVMPGRSTSEIGRLSGRERKGNDMTLKKLAAGTAIALALGTAAVPFAVLANQGGGMGKQYGMGQMDGMGPMGEMGGMFGAGPGFDFAALDTDNDGKITQAEMQAHRQLQVAALDSDGDGLVSADELSSFMSARMADRMKAMAENWVARADSDGDGKLSSAELLAAPIGDRMFERVDADGDGAITEDEIAKARTAFAEHMGERRHQRQGNERGWSFFGWGHRDGDSQ
jgi:Ca2+-binding EF-hand superfamily protein